MIALVNSDVLALPPKSPVRYLPSAMTPSTASCKSERAHLLQAVSTENGLKMYSGLAAAGGQLRMIIRAAAHLDVVCMLVEVDVPQHHAGCAGKSQMAVSKRSVKTQSRSTE